MFSLTSIDDEAEEVEGQEETHAADASSTTTKTQEHAGPARMAAIDLFPNHHNPWLPGMASCSHFSRVLQRFSQQAEMVPQKLTRGFGRVLSSQSGTHRCLAGQAPRVAA
ncbi:hypothetical protein Y1Q_0004024 [Alligator mississippiensis]|uniref:Uncharacterized protein n=1 Tax=Alligator mississippiensis TaxID=8496 RepID=A0A151PHQ6_ALLMI|nr:hypothetical protein Y1Q_0004024 [Alligator mississippiensis]